MVKNKHEEEEEMKKFYEINNYDDFGIQEFVGENIAWAHFDIAGTAFLDKPQKELIKGATGIGIRTIINYINSL